MIILIVFKHPFVLIMSGICIEQELSLVTTAVKYLGHLLALRYNQINFLSIKNVRSVLICFIEWKILNCVGDYRINLTGLKTTWMIVKNLVWLKKNLRWYYFFKNIDMEIYWIDLSQLELICQIRDPNHETRITS